jgi:hypothetical protein
MRYRVNTPPVIHELLDGEVIVVNLDTGTYYGIPSTGAQIWSLVTQGASLDETVTALLGRHETTQAVVEPAVQAFVDELVGEELLEAAAEGDGPAAQPTVLPDNGEARAPFEEPKLLRYTDMQELLLLDPIHEVDERGWPNTPENGRPPAGG